MKYNVGDRVRIKSIDWYNENKNEDGNIPLIENTNSSFNFIKVMRGLCGKVMTISSVSSHYYDMVEDNCEYCWTDEMIEGLVEEKPSNENKEQLLMIRPYTMEIVSHKDYEIIQRDSKFFLEKKKKDYPKTYEECCAVIGISRHDVEIDLPQPYQQKMFNFFKLLICCDAYWKIAGEEMGLGKPWEPDFTDKYSKSYVITAASGIIHTTWTNKQSYILAFPTEEMRDAFYENFKKELEICKKLL